MTRCPHCGFDDQDEEAEHGHELSSQDQQRQQTDDWRDDAAFETALSTPGRDSQRCPECGETF